MLRLVSIKKNFNITLLSTSYIKPALAGGISYLTLFFTNQLINLTNPFLVPFGVALGIGAYVLIFWGLKPTAEDACATTGG